MDQGHVSANDRQVGGSHYRSEYQHWDFIVDHRIGYLEGCSSKYATRWRKKNGLEDVEKGVHYCDKLIEKAELGLHPTGYAPDSALERFFEANDIQDTDERRAITFLCQWESVASLRLAKTYMERLVEKARAAA